MNAHNCNQLEYLFSMDIHIDIQLLVVNLELLKRLFQSYSHFCDFLENKGILSKKDNPCVSAKKCI